MTAVFTALDAFLLFFSREITTISMYLTIAFGEAPMRIQAAIKFVLFS